MLQPLILLESGFTHRLIKEKSAGNKPHEFLFYKLEPLVPWVMCFVDATHVDRAEEANIRVDPTKTDRNDEKK